MKKVLLFFSLFLLLSCNKSSVSVENLSECCCPHATIYLQPYEDFSRREAEKLIPILEEHFDDLLYGHWEFKVLNPISLPDNSKVQGKSKYKAITILHSEGKLVKEGVMIGLTHKDICADAHNVKDYGIVGMSFSPGNVCIVSDKRLSNKSDYWKPIIHEFIHAFYGAKHCPNDDPRCLMKDAKGKGTFRIQNYLCDSCKQ